MEYCTCGLLNNCALNFNGRIDKDERCVTFCCENVENIPGMKFNDAGLEMAEEFIKKRNEILLKSLEIGLTNERRGMSIGCDKCANFVPTNDISSIKGKIHYVNLSMYPAPCQCKCIYCDIHDTEKSRLNKKEHGKYYEKLFDILNYAKEKKLIAENATWQVSSGEITIHPYKKEIMELVKNNVVCFYTNGFIFDEEISNNLSVNPNSAINLSIDAGTPKTWEKVKGVNNFEEVMMNLVKYFNNSSRPGQITLKYIILPGINDSIEDFMSVAEIMKILKCDCLSISRDVCKKYDKTDEELKKLINAAGYLIAILAKNGMKIDMFCYAPEEREAAIALARELLENKKV